MSTTDAQAARDVLSCLSDHRWALLHGVERVLTGTVTSDVDIVVDEPPLVVVAKVRDRVLQSTRLHLCLLWQYDVGALTTVWAESSGRAVQLDLMHDPGGAGKYGIRTEVLLKARVTREGLNVIDEADEYLYLLSKRSRKRDAAALERLLEPLRGANAHKRREVLRGRATSVLAGATARRVVKMLNTGTPVLAPATRRVEDIPRVLRARNPVVRVRVVSTGTDLPLELPFLPKVRVLRAWTTPAWLAARLPGVTLLVGGREPAAENLDEVIRDLAEHAESRLPRV